MSTVKRGLSGSVPRMQSREVNRRDNNSLVIDEVWQCSKSSFLSLIPALETEHPTYLGTFLAGDFKGKEESDIITYNLHYEGYNNEGGIIPPASNPPVYWWDGSESVRPITYLARGAKTFAALVASARGYGEEPLDTKGIFIDFPKGAKSVSGIDIQGLTEFLDIDGTWNCERFASSAPDVNNGCKIDTSPPGTPPTLPTGMTWLYLTPSYKKINTSLYFIKETWKPGYWNCDIYDTKP